MTAYTLLNLVVLAGAALVALALTCATPAEHRAPPRAVGFALLALLALTAVFDNVIIGVGLVAYDPGRISGILVGLAPIEDFAYSVAAALVIPSLWTFLDARAGRA